MLEQDKLDLEDLIKTVKHAAQVISHHESEELAHELLLGFGLLVGRFCSLDEALTQAVRLLVVKKDGE